PLHDALPIYLKVSFRLGAAKRRSAPWAQRITARSQRLSDASLPHVAQCKRPQPQIQRNAKPEPRRATSTLHAADAPKHTAGANTIDSQANHQQPHDRDPDLTRHA